MGGSGGIAPPFLTLALDGGGQLQALAVLLPDREATKCVYKLTFKLSKTIIFIDRPTAYSIEEYLKKRLKY
jgi:hypothetical protein